MNKKKAAKNSPSKQKKEELQLSDSDDSDVSREDSPDISVSELKTPKSNAKGKSPPKKGKKTEESKAPAKDKKSEKSGDKKKAGKEEEKKKEPTKKGKKSRVSETESDADAEEDENALKPKKASSAWIYFNTEYVAKLKEKGVPHREAFKKSGETWGTMTEKQKEPYFKKAEADTKRFKEQTEMLEEKGYFILEDGSKSTDAKNRPKKVWPEDTLLPKKPNSAYIFFTTAEVNNIKERENLKKHTDAMKKAGEIWREMDDKEKKPYVKLHEKDVVRYEKQMAEMEKNGYFKMADGSKSSDYKAKVKRPRKKAEPESESDEEEVEESEEEEKPVKMKKAKK